MEDETPFFIGGLWDVWHAREPEALFTLTVLTTFPNEISRTRFMPEAKLRWRTAPLRHMA
jgi:putative SOS response-associated peptidase YedK